MFSLIFALYHHPLKIDHFDARESSRGWTITTSPYFLNTGDVAIVSTVGLWRRQNDQFSVDGGIDASWAETTLAQMTVEEKVGQLFIAPACPLRGEDHRKDLRFLIDHYHIGGIILKQGDPDSQIALINELVSPIPLLHFADAEWGVSMRLQQALKFPRNLTLGAIQNESLLFRFGKQIGWECAQVGIDLNFAPVVDVNTNSLNPIIGTRSFGQDSAEVANRALLVMKGMQAAGTLSCAKHFPGHGETSVDSHVDLPVIEKLELLPFEKMVKNGVDCVMTGHLFYQPTIPDAPEKGEIVTFSRNLVEGILRDSWHFERLICTDALNMAALRRYHSPESIALKALLAGHDLLLWGDHRSEIVDPLLRDAIPKAIEKIIEAVDSGVVSQELLDSHVLRILKEKEARGLKRYFPNSENLITEEAKALKRELYRSAITLVSNNLLPLEARSPVNVIQFGSDKTSFIPTTSSAGTTIIALYDVTPEALAFLKTVKAPYVIVLFTNAYNLFKLGDHPTILVAYENDPDAEEAAADVIFGRLEAKGKLPIK